MRIPVSNLKFFLIVVFIFTGLFFACDQAQQKQRENSPFSFKIETDPETAWDVISLIYQPDSGDTTKSLVQIVPQAGNKISSFIVMNQELLVNPTTLKDLPVSQSGISIIYPTPYPVSKEEVQINNLKIQFPISEKDSPFAGFLKDAAWEYAPPEIDELGITLKTWLDFEEGKPWYATFSIKHRINVFYKLKKQGLQIRFLVENKDTQPLPVGFGARPVFRISGSPEDVLVTLPGLNKLELKNQLPTGNFLPPRFPHQENKNRLISITELAPFEIYWGFTPLKPAKIELVDQNLSIELKASREFTHAAYVKSEAPAFFSVSNLTSSPNTHHLHQQGLIKQAHLIIIEPGQSTDGFIEYVISKLK